MRYTHRCTDKRRCGKGVTLSRKIDEYIRRPMCPGCGKDTLKYVNYRGKHKACTCDAYWFPHRKGSSVWCTHSDKEPTEEDYKKRYGE